MNKTALIVVDMVYDFTNRSGKVFYQQNEVILPKIKNLIKICRDKGCLVIFIEHTLTKEMHEKQIKKTRECCIEGTGGDLTDERLKVDYKKDLVIKKHKYSSFYDTSLDWVLKQNKIENLLVVGTKTNNCIYATVLDAYNLDYKTIVVKDLVGTSDNLTNDIYLRDMGKYLCDVVNFEDVLNLLEKEVI